MPQPGEGSLKTELVGRRDASAPRGFGWSVLLFALPRLTAGVLTEMLAAVNVPVPPVDPHRRSLSEVHSSVEIPRQLSFWRRFFAFSGPAYLISVGYMDPGNWAT